MAEYGIPYMGSKGAICNEIIARIPKAENFYDLFGGGFSITHAMFLRRGNDFKHFNFNEPRPGVVKLIQDAIEGKYNYKSFKPKWISREEFALRKDSDPYIKLCWSFGNNGQNYLFGKDIEDYKRSLHNAVVFNEFDSTAKEVLGMCAFKDGFSVLQRRLFVRWKVKHNTGTVEKLQQLEQLLRLEQLQQLEQLQRLQRLELSAVSYDEVEIKPNSVIYCDPPYRDTGEYDTSFDHVKFYGWALNQKAPVFISEYAMPKEFHEVFKIKKVVKLYNSKATKTNKFERLYTNDAGMRALGLKRSPYPV